MRLIHQSDYSLEERLMYKPIVYANAIQSMSILLNAVEKLSQFSVFSHRPYALYTTLPVLPYVLSVQTSSISVVSLSFFSQTPCIIHYATSAPLYFIIKNMYYLSRQAALV
jgi:hypothetical protein